MIGVNRVVDCDRHGFVVRIPCRVCDLNSHTVRGADLVVDQRPIRDGDFSGAAVNRKAPTRVVSQTEGEAGKYFTCVPLDHVAISASFGIVCPGAISIQSGIVFTCCFRLAKGRCKESVGGRAGVAPGPEPLFRFSYTLKPVPVAIIVAIFGAQPNVITGIQCMLASQIVFILRTNRDQLTVDTIKVRSRPIGQSCAEVCC